MTTLSATSAADTRRSSSAYAAPSHANVVAPAPAGKASQALVNWLNAVAPSVLRCGSRVCVTGCGVGDDAMAFIGRGYDVTAFDISPAVIECAKQRFDGHRDTFKCADIFDPPSSWRHRFDLVADVNNLHTFGADEQGEAIGHFADLMSPHGRMLIIADATEEDGHTNDDGAVPLSPSALARHASLAGLTLSEPAMVFEDDDSDPPALCLRAMLERA